MKQFLLLASILVLSAAMARAAETAVRLSNVHLCCNACVRGVDKAIAGVSGVTAKSDRNAGAVTLTAPDRAAAQKAVDALVAAGYFGVSSDPAVKVVAESGAKDEQVKSLKVTGLHLCCNQCVTSVNETLSKVPGVKANTAARGAETFEVTGDFNAKEVFTALNKAGLSAKAGK